jgi:hypothetical protein
MYDEYEKKTRRRFLKKIKRDPNTGCIRWTARCFHNGYGQFHYRGRKIKAHRYVAWKFGIINTLGSKQVVCHRCDNPSCINPRHLFAGSQKDNVRDSIKKGRFSFNHRQNLKRGGHYGATHPQAILSEKDILTIRAKYASGISQRALAREYGVARTTISSIVIRRSWRHI